MSRVRNGNQKKGQQMIPSEYRGNLPPSWFKSFLLSYFNLVPVYVVNLHLKLGLQNQSVSTDVSFWYKAEQMWQVEQKLDSAQGGQGMLLPCGHFHSLLL